MNAIPYTPFYCEENVWQRCRAFPDGFAIFISNAERACPMWSQRAAPPGEAVFWDYHVVFVDADKDVWDPDCTEGMPLSLAGWVAATFPMLKDTRRVYLPQFRLMTAQTMLDAFASDRSHMRSPNGAWLEPPPDYPPIRTEHATMTLPALWDVSVNSPGEWLEAADLVGMRWPQSV